ncbi:TlpA family protein disulfide reductase [Sphingomonas jaspsi]|uniref:TlpA family protein disulfide reductase n=1 Tax=Sphingomonas jaspsi TaxID=392409 RepID=UPI0004B03A5C|nr:hypothetical protein [Sphingomonas jaspsi]
MLRFSPFVLSAALAIASSAYAAVPSVGASAAGNVFNLDNGQKLAVDDLKGMVVVVTYWAEGCKACDDQVKLVDYYARRTPNVGLVALLAPVDVTAPGIVRGAARGTSLYPVRSVGGWLEPMDAAPTTYVIDRRGQVRFAGTGVMSIEKLNEVLMPVIREPQPPM